MLSDNIVFGVPQFQFNLNWCLKKKKKTNSATDSVNFIEVIIILINQNSVNCCMMKFTLGNRNKLIHYVIN